MGDFKKDFVELSLWKRGLPAKSYGTSSGRGDPPERYAVFKSENYRPRTGCGAED